MAAFTPVSNVEIQSVANKGDLSRERVVLRAKRACDLVNYLVLDMTYLPSGQVSDRNRHVFWFPHHMVAEGDYVLIYSRSGKGGRHVDTQGRTVHSFYWGLNHSVWNKDDDAVTLINLNRVSYKKV